MMLFRKAAPILGCAAVLAALAGQASAQMAQTIFGHEVVVLEGTIADRLKIGGETVLEDGRIDILTIDLAGEVPVAVGWTGSGGNLCASVPFVIFFSEDAARLDVSPVECLSLPHRLGDGEIIFEVSIDGVPGLRWTPEGGFKVRPPS